MTADDWKIWQARAEEREKVLAARIGRMERVIYGLGAVLATTLLGSTGGQIVRTLAAGISP